MSLYIGVVCRILWPGGIARVAIAEAEELSKLGYKVDLVFLRRTNRKGYAINFPHRVINEAKSNERIIGRFLRIITYYFNSDRGPESTIDLDYLLKFEITRPKYDIIIYTDQLASIFSSIGKILKGGKTVIHIFETARKSKNINTSLQRYIERVGVFKHDAIIASSDTTKEILIDAGYENVYTIYQGAPNEIKRIPIEEKTDTAISVTMWDAWRQPELYADIARRLTFGKLVLAGNWADEAYRVRFLERILNMHLEDKIEVTGPLSQDELEELYKKAKVFIRFGKNELGMGTGNLEAISYGIPLVVNKSIGVSRFIEDGKSGFIVEEKDIECIATKIEKLFTDTELWTRMSSNVTEMAIKMTWQSRSRELEEIILSVASD